MYCVRCKKNPTKIRAAHKYTIEYDAEQDKWVKSIGDVVYSCGLCLKELDIGDIYDILKQVDEL